MQVSILGAIARSIRRFFNATLDIYIYILLLVTFVITAYPFWYILVYSLSDPVRITSGFLLLPKGINLQAYTSVFQSKIILNAFFISVSRSVAGPLASGLISMLVAYGLSHRDLPGRRFLALFFILTMYFGAGLIPYYMLMKTLKFINTFWIYIIPGLMNVFGMVLMRTYVESLPQSLEESALIDGASDLTIFFRITVPLCLPVIAAIMLFSCVGHWNSYTDTLIYNSGNESLYTLQYVLVTFVTTVSASQNVHAINDLINSAGHVKLTPMVVRMAITIIAIIPISLVYPFLQRYFIKGMLIGAIKG